MLFCSFRGRRLSVLPFLTLLLLAFFGLSLSGSSLTSSSSASSSSSSSLVSSVSSSSAQRRQWSRPSHRLVYHRDLSRRLHENFTGSVAGEVELECDLKFPGDGKWIPYTFKWTKLGASKPLFFRFPGYPPHLDAPYRKRVRMTVPANIRMSDLRPEDEGWYHCLISYMNRVPEDMPSPNGTWVYLAIMSPPSFVETSESTVVFKEGLPLRLHCRADGKPAPEISWFRDGFLLGASSSQPPSSSSSSPASSSSRIRVNGEFLEIASARRADVAVYVCRAKNSVGEAHRSIKVLQGGVSIMTPPANLTVVEGRRVELSCAAEARPDNITYHWSRVGGGNGASASSTTTVSSVLKDPSLGPRSKVEKETGTLVISSIFGSDLGWYFCEATNGLSSSTAKAYLNVTYAPKLLRMPKTLYLAKGRPAKIACRVDANPPVDDVKWTKDGRPMIERRRNGKKEYVADALSPQVTADLKTFGISMGSSSSSFSSTTKKRSISSSSSSSDWRFLDRGLTVFFVRASLGDEGAYSCSPSNSIGSGSPSVAVRVFVRDPPVFTLVPRQYEQRTLDDSVTLACAAEGDPTPVIRWRKLDIISAHDEEKGTNVYVRVDDSDDNNDDGDDDNLKWEDNLPKERVRMTEGNLTLSGLVLRDAGRYECRAENVVTAIVATVNLIIEVTTPHVPFNLSVATSHFSATVSWLPAYNAGLPLQYVLWFKRLGRDKMDWKTVRIHPDDATSFAIHDLLPDAGYEFSIQAKTNSGDGMFSKVIRMRTKSLDDTSGLRSVGEALKRTDSASSSSFQRGAVDVAADSAFDYRLLDDARAAIRRNGDEDEEDRGDGRRFELLLASELGLSRPEPPLALTIHPLATRNGLNVTWSVDANSTVPASFFIVEYRSRDSIGWQEEKPLLWSALTDRLVDRNWATIYDGRPGFRYEFRVFAFSAFNTFSASSEVASYVVPTELPPTGSIVVSTAAIAGMAGGLAFLLVTATLSVAAVHLVKRRSAGNADRDRERDKKKFHSIKYIDARHANGHHHPHLRAIHIEHLSGASV